MTKPILDGAGVPLDPDGDYYVQDTRGVVGNCASFWCPDGAGYTCEIGKAGVYKGAKVATMRHTDVGWPLATIEAIVVRHARSDQMPWAPGRWPTSPVDRSHPMKAERCDLCGRFVSFRSGRHTEPGVVRHPQCDDDETHRQGQERSRREYAERRSDEILLGRTTTEVLDR